MVAPGAAAVPDRAHQTRRAPSLLGAVQRIGRPVFTTKELAAVRGTSVSSSVQSLQRLAEEGVIVHVRRGVWAVPGDPTFTPHALVAPLAASHPAYVSFLTALRLHGIIEQIPQVIYAATTAHSRVIRTPLGTFSFHQLTAPFFAGYDWYGDRQSYLIATPEKALVDCLYLAGRRGRRFSRLVDLELGSAFRIGAAREWTRRIADVRLRRYVSARLEEVWGGR
jgi:predicted transcriptional regulator of viral defense system